MPDVVLEREAVRTEVFTPHIYPDVKRVQEWLCLQGYSVPVDNKWGPASKRALEQFCYDRQIDSNGFDTVPVLSEDLWTALCQPMRDVVLAPLRFRPPHFVPSYGVIVRVLALTHLQAHPREIGGQNRGPWVRLYMDGKEGNDWAWCAGFVSFVMAQAGDAYNATLPTTPHPTISAYRCRDLVAMARQLGWPVLSAPKPDCEIHLFFVNHKKRNPWDSPWSHVGFGYDFQSDGTFTTIEGNTNDEGSAEGYEVCTRTRSIADKTFIPLY